MYCSRAKSSDIENVDWTGVGRHNNNIRFGSSSSQASQSSGDICRICHCESDPLNPLLTPCYCSGSLKYVHQTCLQQWLTASETNSCELCKFPFIMHTKIKPFNEWRSLDMSGVERRRLCCAILFHFAAALCVIWSLCVLIERATEEVKKGLIGWPFWTKLVVVTVGLTGGIVFMFIQCKQYLSLCNRWRSRNRILLIQNAPEKILNHQHSSPVLQQCGSSSSRQMPRNNSVSACGVGAVGGGGGGGGGGIGSGGGGCSGSGHNSTLLNNRLLDNSNYDNMIIGQSMIQGQIVANIENNSINYERDWTLDDISQISQVSFRPCPQGSGSLTPLPFHDSINNIYESVYDQQILQQQQQQQMPPPQQQQQPQQQQFVTNAKMMPNNKTNDLNLFKYHSTDGEQQQQQQPPFNHPLGLTTATTTAAATTTTLPSSHLPNSSVFLENRDILNDKDYPKLFNNHKICYRHSSILLSPDSEMNNDNNYMFYNNTNFSRQLQQHHQQQQQLQQLQQLQHHQPHLMLYQQPNNKLANKDLHYVNRRYSDTKLLLQQQLENQLLLMKNQNIDLTKILGSPIHQRHQPSAPATAAATSGSGASGPSARQMKQQPYEHILYRTNTTVHPLATTTAATTTVTAPHTIVTEGAHGTPPPPPPPSAASANNNMNNLFFEQIANDSFDPSDLNENIQQMIELDIKNQQKLLLYKQQQLELLEQQHEESVNVNSRNSKKLMKLSLDNVLNTTEQQLDNMADASNKKNIFKSLPNLSSSSENLLP